MLQYFDHASLSSAALLGPDAICRRLDRGVPRGAGLVFGECAVGGPEPQRQRQGFAALADLRTGVDVEQPDVLQQVPRASRTASTTS